MMILLYFHAFLEPNSCGGGGGGGCCLAIRIACIIHIYFYFFRVVEKRISDKGGEILAVKLLIINFRGGLVRNGEVAVLFFCPS